MKKILLLAAVTFAGFAANAQPPKVAADKGATFGAPGVTADNAVPVEQMIADMKGKTGKVDVKIKGTVTEVCQEMGCWIKVKTADGATTVRMKDHKFFVPVILSGKQIVIDGTAEERVSTVEQLRHLAEDGGKSKEEIAKITEPKKEIVIQAKSILVL
ncbi:DUF4920 domain-containing protein [Sediminibacterium roseum]|uniref:DUF4920 domain-containing protein n=1 Tax=Sediminibacterium roseum TaxID=1978412 RepID=A0ABW9ZYU4_9BACT|nr:DUF4920 domain-containing protein [Sediminibacterium roseum]NCI50892.1 DUF4920 domain-containing protein [Sediminibacterium roseum]